MFVHDDHRRFVHTITATYGTASASKAESKTISGSRYSFATSVGTPTIGSTAQPSASSTPKSAGMTRNASSASSQRTNRPGRLYPCGL